MTVARLASALLLAALSSCTPAGERSNAPPVQPAPTRPLDTAAAPAASGSSVPARDPAADAIVAEALAIVSRVRGLPAKAKVPGVRMDRDALRAEVARLMAEEAPPELVTGQTELLFALDTVTADFDLQATLTLLYGQELAGFYDPTQKRMVLASDLGESGERMTLYHELVHALQDQHYGLEQALDWKSEQSDVLAALHALCEGDATSAMFDVFAAAAGAPAPEIPPSLLQLDQLMLQATPDLAGVPGIISRSLVVPYSDGLGFITFLRKNAGNWAGVDGAWRRQPASTEQILHPEKYLANEPVVPIAAIDAPPGFSPMFRDVMGEESLRLLFEEWAPPARAAEAASDWGGDRFVVFSAHDTHVVLWHLAFDTEAAAIRGLTTLARGAIRAELGPKPPKTPSLRDFADADAATKASRSGQFCRDRPQRGAFAAVRQGRHIGVTLGPYARTGVDVRAAGTCPQSLQWAAQLAHQQ